MTEPLPFSVSGFTHQSFSYALCEHRRWTGKKAARAKSIVGMCDEWSRESPRILELARAYGGSRVISDAEQKCRKHVGASIGISSWLFIELIKYVVGLFIRWYLFNYNECRKAQGRQQ